MQRFFVVLAGVAVLGAGCWGNGDFTYSNGDPNLPDPIFGNEASQRPAPTGPMEIQSSAFAEGQPIPERYTCNGSDFSPPVTFTNVPLEAVGLVLLAEDIDAPEGFTHWAVFNMPASVTAIEEGDIAPGALGTSSGGRLGYEGPCPPDGQHRYAFTLYAITSALDVTDGATGEEVKAALEGKVAATATLMGTYGE